MTNLTFSEYQEMAYRTAKYLEPVKITYPLLGLVGEAGEVCELIKKWLRRDNGTELLDTEKLAKELGDVLWYLAALCTDLGIELAPNDGIDRTTICAWETTRTQYRSKQLEQLNYIPRNALGLDRRVAVLVDIVNDFTDAGFSMTDAPIEQIEYVHEGVDDVLYAIVVLSKFCKQSLAEIAQLNLDKLHDRERRGVIQGDGDER